MKSDDLDAILEQLQGVCEVIVIALVLGWLFVQVAL